MAQDNNTLTIDGIPAVSNMRPIFENGKQTGFQREYIATDPSNGRRYRIVDADSPYTIGQLTDKLHALRQDPGSNAIRESSEVGPYFPESLPQEMRLRNVFAGYDPVSQKDLYDALPSFYDPRLDLPNISIGHSQQPIPENQGRGGSSIDTTVIPSTRPGPPNPRSNYQELDNSPVVDPLDLSAPSALLGSSPSITSYYYNPRSVAPPPDNPFAVPQPRGGSDTSYQDAGQIGIAVPSSPRSDRSAIADDFAAALAGVKQLPKGTIASSQPESPMKQLHQKLQAQQDLHEEDLQLGYDGTDLLGDADRARMNGDIARANRFLALYRQQPLSDWNAFLTETPFQILPTLAGTVAAPIGAAGGAALGTLGGPAAPFTIPAGSAVGSFAAASQAAGAVDRAQDAVLHAYLHPEIYQALHEKRQLGAQQHPLGTFAATVVPSLLTERVGSGQQVNELGQAARASISGTASKLSPEIHAGVRATVGNAARNAATQSGIDLGTQAVGQAQGADGSFDLRRIDPRRLNYKQALARAAVGAIQSGGRTQFGEALAFPGESLYPTAQVSQAQNAAVAASYLNGLIRNTPMVTESPNTPLIQPQDSVIGSQAAIDRGRQILADTTQRMSRISEVHDGAYDSDENNSDIGANKRPLRKRVASELRWSTNSMRLKKEFTILRDEIEKLTRFKSKWKGDVLIGEDRNEYGRASYAGRKEWKCPITMHEDTLTGPPADRYATQSHEMFHSVSADAMDPNIYYEYMGYEEGVVEHCTRIYGPYLFKKLGIKEAFPRRTAYQRYVDDLEVCRKACGSDIDPQRFYTMLLGISLPSRESTLDYWIRNNNGGELPMEVKTAMEDLKIPRDAEERRFNIKTDNTDSNTK